MLAVHHASEATLTYIKTHAADVVIHRRLQLQRQLGERSVKTVSYYVFSPVVVLDTGRLDVLH